MALSSYLCFMVPHTDTAIVQTGQHPWLGRVKVHALHSVRPGCQPPLYVQPQRLQKRNERIVTGCEYPYFLLHKRTAPLVDFCKNLPRLGGNVNTRNSVEWSSLNIDISMLKLNLMYFTRWQKNKRTHEFNNTSLNPFKTPLSHSKHRQLSRANVKICSIGCQLNRAS